MRWGVFLRACVVGVWCVAAAGPAWAQRATPEQMDAAVRPLDEYLKDVRTNYGAIEGLILKRGKADAAQLVARFAAERDATKDPLDQSVYNYLLARTRYWDAFLRFKATFDRGVFDAARPKVVEDYLAAFRCVEAAKDPPEPRASVRQDVVGSFFSVLGTNIWGQALTPAEKARVSEEFLAVLERDPDAETVIPADQTAFLAYRNVAREFFWVKRLAGNLPKDYPALRGLLAKCRGGVPAPALLPLVAALENGHDEHLDKDPEVWADMAEVCAGAERPKDALRLFTRAAGLRSGCYLPFYLFGLRFPDDLEGADPRQWLDRYIAGSHPEPAAGYTRESAYQRAETALMSQKFFAQCFDLIVRWEEDAAVRRTPQLNVRFSFDKAVCCEETGRKNDAVRQYQRLLGEIEGNPEFQSDARNCRRRLDRLLNAKQERAPQGSFSPPVRLKGRTT